MICKTGQLVNRASRYASNNWLSLVYVSFFEVFFQQFVNTKILLNNTSYHCADNSIMD